MTTSLVERIKWVLLSTHFTDEGTLAEQIVKEIESTHCIVNPDVVTDSMLDACFGALPEHYDPPDPKRRLWHAFKAKRRYTAMVKAAPKEVENCSQVERSTPES